MNPMFDCIETGSLGHHEILAHPPTALRIVSWNIARGVCIGEITDFLAATKADLILLQECDRNCRRTASRNIASEVAQSLRMDYAFAIEFEELGQRCNATPAVHGQATLSRWPLSTSRIIRFQRQSSFWAPRWWIPAIPEFQRRQGGRIALASSLSVGSTSLIVYNLHLESRNSDEVRLAQLSEVLKDVRDHASEVLTVIGGDFNFDVTRDTAGTLLHAAGFNNPFAELRQSTISNSSGRRAIDWIVVRCSNDVRCATVHNAIRGSDHYPLSLTVNLR